MTLPSSGPISASDIINEFGATRDNSSNPDRTRIGDYRKVSSSPTSGSPSFSNYPHNLGELSFSSLDSLNSGGSIPTSGIIRFSDFRGTKLQQVVNFHSSGAGGTRLNAYERYDDNGEIGSSEAVVCVGNHKTRPQNSSNTRVHIHVNKSIGSNTGGDDPVKRCALRTGSGWESGTELRVDVGGEGRIQGAGGDGGNGSSGSGKGGNGTTGSSGLGVQYGTAANETVISIASGGIIRCGYGGGGGGGGGNEQDHKSEDAADGGRGIGGAGLPAGEGGKKGTGGGGGQGDEGGSPNGAAGEEGSTNAGGGGGAESVTGEEEARGGHGGNGGDQENVNAEDGEEGEGGEGSGGAGGERGGNGAAIRKTNSNIQFELQESISSNNGATNATGVL